MMLQGECRFCGSLERLYRTTHDVRLCLPCSHRLWQCVQVERGE